MRLMAGDLEKKFWRFVMNRILSFFIVGCVIFAFSCGGRVSDSKTVENLKAAINGETKACASYAAFSKKAAAEKLDKIALLFEAASKAEGIHAKNHTAVLEKLGLKMDVAAPEITINSTAENLAAAIKGETYEVNTMYPEFITAARADKQADAVTSFDYAFQVEKRHRDLYTAALESLNGKDFKNMQVLYAVCPVCGNTYAGTFPENCEICGTMSSSFIMVR